MKWLRQLRHKHLTSYDPAWRALGRLYRGLLRFVPGGFMVKRTVGGFGPFKLHPQFAFMDLDAWGSSQNSQFTACVDAARGRSCFIDVGAHVGFVTLPVSRVLHPSGRVYAFEPSLANFRLLRDHLVANEASNVLPIQSLVGPEDSTAIEFFEHPRPSGMNSVVRKSESAGELVLRDQISLDTFCKVNMVRPDVIKIDVEGAEFGVLRGAETVIELYRPILFLSVHPDQMHELGTSLQDLENLLRIYGYDPGELRRASSESPASSFEVPLFPLEPRTS